MLPERDVLPPSSFPFAGYRPGQQEAIDGARAAFGAGKRVVVIEAPTGAGKSAIAVTLAREANSAFILTHQKILQDQYAREFPDVAPMKGRANYDCLVAPTNAAAAPCIVGKRYPACVDCLYFTAKETAITADVAALNYAYFLAELNYAGGFSQRDLLVLDEAHNAEAALMGFAQLHLSEAQLMRAGLPPELPPALGDELMFEYAETLIPEVNRRAAAVETALAGRTLTDHAAAEQLQVKQWLASTAERLSLIVDSYYRGDVDWVVDRYRSRGGEALTFKPVDVAALAEPLLFGHAKRVLMLSATVLDAPTFLRGLGLHPEDAEIIKVASSFPARNRPVVLRPSARLTRHHIDRELPNLLAAVTDIAMAHEGQKGVVHSHSYKIGNYLVDNLPEEVRWRVVTHDSAEGRDAALAKHVESDAPTILLTPSMTQGIDLADDLARWQVLCKVPYPNLGDKQIKARMERDRGWYDWRTALAVVQAYGRCVRSETDHAVTYLLDADFPAFIRRQAGTLPGWFLEAVDY